MKKSKILGIALSSIGALIFLSSYFGITGNVILSESSFIGFSWISVFGIFIFLSGIFFITISYSASEYRNRDSRLQRALGDRYRDISEQERISLNRSLRKYDTKQSKNKDYHEKMSNRLPSKDLGVIYTEQFKRAIKGYDPKPIEATIRKLQGGIGKIKRIHHDGDGIILEARVDEKARIIFSRNADGKYVLHNYSPDHELKKLGYGNKKS
jgi:hypothetical protein